MVEFGRCFGGGSSHALVRSGGFPVAGRRLRRGGKSVFVGGEIDDISGGGGFLSAAAAAAASEGD